MKTLALILTQLFLWSNCFAVVHANYNDDRVEISWNNPKHIQVDYFVIERSKDGESFKPIQTVKAALKNNGNDIEYFEIDNKPFNKKAYYRIKQVDINSERYYSEVIMAKNPGKSKSLFNLFHCTKKNKDLKGYKGDQILVVLKDQNQQQFIAKVNLLEEKFRLITTQSNVYLPTGEYIITATSDDRIYGEKLNVIGNYVNTAYIQNKKQR